MTGVLIGDTEGTHREIDLAWVRSVCHSTCSAATILSVVENEQSSHSNGCVKGWLASNSSATSFRICSSSSSISRGISLNSGEKGLIYQRQDLWFTRNFDFEKLELF